MINSKTVDSLRPRIQDAVKSLLDIATQNQKNPNDIVLYLMNAHYDERIAKIGNLTGHLVGPGEKGLDDEYRMEFVIDYLNSGNESLIENISQEEIDRRIRYTLHLELMIYTHFWETDVVLKDLKQLANLISNKSYDWQNNIPELGKYEFIRDEIRAVYLSHHLDAGLLIKEAYRSQLRNAFAHGQYALRVRKSIELLNYKGESHEIERISHEDWESKFLKTVIFYYELIHQKIDLLIKISKSNPTITIWLPTKKTGVLTSTNLVWNEPGRRYTFEQK